MGDLLDELRAQRALIRRHLDWLDGKIEELEDKSNPPVESSPKATEEPELKEAQDRPTVNEIENPSAVVRPNPLDSYREPTSNQMMRAKLGCLVIFAASTLLFLFLLFGLPYLMD